MRPFSQCLWPLDNLQDMPQLHQCLSVTGASSRFWPPHWTLKHTLILPCAWLLLFCMQEKVCTWWVEPAERLPGLILFFAENPRALLLSCYFCQMLWAPNGDSGKNTVSQCFPILLSHQVDFLPSHIGALCTASQPYPQGQSALVVFNFKAFHSHLWGRHSHKT